MEIPASQVEEQQMRALAFALDRVFAPAAAPPTRAELEVALAAVRAENRLLRARVRELERALHPDEAELEAYEREMERRLAGERERAVGDPFGWLADAPPGNQDQRSEASSAMVVTAHSPTALRAVFVSTAP